MLHNPVLLQLIKQFPDDLLPVVIDGITQNIQNESKFAKDQFGFSKSKPKTNAGNSGFRVVPANLKCNFAFSKGPHWNQTVRGMSYLALKKLGEELGSMLVD